MHITPKVKEYVTSEIYKSKLIKSSKEVQSTLAIIKCNENISCKFKIVKFIA